MGENFATYSKLNTKIINNPMNKWANELDGNFSNEEVRMANKYIKKCPISLAIRKMQSKTTLRFHLPCQNGHHQENKEQQC
jgi:hypothetical protein